MRRKNNLLVAMQLEEIEGELILVVDHPDEKEAVTLHVLERKSLDFVVGHRRVGNRHASGGVGRRELPWRVHADDVEEAACVLHLALT